MAISSGTKPPTKSMTRRNRGVLTLGSMLMAWGCQAQTPAGFISAYAPQGNVPREQIVEVTRSGQSLSLKDLPRFVVTGDIIRLKRKEASVTLAMGDGSSVVVKWSEEPYVVPVVNARTDWTRLFRPLPSKRTKLIEALTSKSEFGPLLYPNPEPFAVQYHMGTPYVSATLSMYPSMVRGQEEPVRIFKLWLPEDVTASAGMWKAEALEPIVLFTGQENQISWMNGTGPFEFKLTMVDGVSVKVPKAGAGLGTSSVSVDGRWLTPGWATFFVRDAHAKVLSAYALTVDPNQLLRCPFTTGPHSSVSLDAAVVCDAWREHGGKVKGFDKKQ